VAKKKYIETPEIKSPELEFELPFKKINGGYKVFPNTKHIGGKNSLRNNASKKTKKAYVYLLNVSGTNKYKIGVSKRPKRRLSDISSVIPFDLELLAINEIINPYEFEQEIINKFKSKLIKNEWFELSLDDVIYIMITLHNTQVEQLSK
jgi:hypothetical protein